MKIQGAKGFYIRDILVIERGKKTKRAKKHGHKVVHKLELVLGKECTHEQRATKFATLKLVEHLIDLIVEYLETFFAVEAWIAKLVVRVRRRFHVQRNYLREASFFF